MINKMPSLKTIQTVKVIQCPKVKVISTLRLRPSVTNNWVFWHGWTGYVPFRGLWRAVERKFESNHSNALKNASDAKRCNVKSNALLCNWNLCKKPNLNSVKILKIMKKNICISPTQTPNKSICFVSSELTIHIITNTINLTSNALNLTKKSDPHKKYSLPYFL